MIFFCFQKVGFLGIVGTPNCSIGQEMLCLPYAGFFLKKDDIDGRVCIIVVIYLQFFLIKAYFTESPARGMIGFRNIL